MTDKDFRKEAMEYHEIIHMSTVITLLAGVFLVGMPAYFGNLVVFPSIIAFLLAVMWVCIVLEMRNSKGKNDWYDTLEYMFCKNKYSVLEPGKKYRLQGFDVEVHLISYGRNVHGVTLGGAKMVLFLMIYILTIKTD